MVGSFVTLGCLSVGPLVALCPHFAHTFTQTRIVQSGRDGFQVVVE